MGIYRLLSQNVVCLVHGKAGFGGYIYRYKNVEKSFHWKARNVCSVVDNRELRIVVCLADGKGGLDGYINLRARIKQRRM